MNVICFDTETTGLFDYRKPADADGQPRMIQIAASLFDADRSLITSLSSLIKPDGWEMDDALAEKLGHGLNHAKLEAEGIPVRDALDQWNEMQQRADMIIGFNVAFDLKVIRGELRRADLPDQYGEKETFCVMHACTPLCRIPPTAAMLATNRKTRKTPNLAEAVETLLGEKVEGAHNANADCVATYRLFCHLLDNGHGPAAKTKEPPKKTAPTPTDDESDVAFLNGESK